MLIKCTKILIASVFVMSLKILHAHIFFIKQKLVNEILLHYVKKRMSSFMVNEALNFKMKILN